MAAMFGGDGQIPLEQWFFETPVLTRYWTTAVVVTGILVQCQIVTPFQLFYSYRAVFSKGQVRLPSLYLTSITQMTNLSLRSTGGY